jgi:hypothetical protein
MTMRWISKRDQPDEDQHQHGIDGDQRQRRRRIRRDRGDADQNSERQAAAETSAAATAMHAGSARRRRPSCRGCTGVLSFRGFAWLAMPAVSETLIAAHLCNALWRLCNIFARSKNV